MEGAEFKDCHGLASDLEFFEVVDGDPLLPEGAEKHLVFGCYYINEYMAEFARRDR